MLRPANSSRQEIFFRRARPDDLHFIAQELTRLRLDAEELDPNQFYLAIAGDKIIGFGRIKRYQGICEMASVAVLEEYRGKGIGREIAGRLVNDCPNKTVYLVTDIPAFFEKLGFKITADYPTILGEKLRTFCAQVSSEPVVAMVLKLKSAC